MALTLEDCRAMMAAARSSGVQLIVGHSHSFDAPILRAREIIDSGAVGRVRMITALDFTDFLYRPRRPEELDTARGGGAVFNQAAHQVDIVRLLAGGRVSRVRALTGRWDQARPTEGAYAACSPSTTARSRRSSTAATRISTPTSSWAGSASWDGRRILPGMARHARCSRPRPTRRAQERPQLRQPRRHPAGRPGAHQHFGVVVVSCDHADLRPLPHGVMIYGDTAQRLDPLPAPAVPRAEVIDELYDAVVNGVPPVHSGEWAMATLEVCLAILRSAREGTEISLENQTGLREAAAARR